MVFSTVIIVGLAIELPGDRGPGRGHRPRLPRRRHRLVSGFQLAQQGFVADWNLSDL